MTIFTNTLPAKTGQLVQLIQVRKPQFLDTFYLSGGTGLSLQLGHRESEDLDFFTKQLFSPQQLEQAIVTFGQLSQTELAEGTLNTFIEGVKVQFLHYPYPLLEPLIDWNGIKISSILDIACTKLQTISMRGSKKDFVDLYFLLDQYTLVALLEAVKRKYISSNYNQAHIIKSLVYFDDAETQPMPRMHKDVDWESVKAKMIASVKELTLL